MDFKEYQEKAGETALYPNEGSNFIYPTLGLVGEAGELANKVKKVIRDDGGIITEEKRESLKKELGDILWYVAQLSTELKLSLEEVAEYNIKKLKSRKERGVLNGEGDNR